MVRTPAPYYRQYNRKSIWLTVAYVALSWLTVDGQQSQTTLRPKIESIVSRLKTENGLHLGAPVGYAGKPETDNKYYKLYKRLSTKAKDEELVHLTNDNSKVIVLYAFDILSSRGYPGLKDVFLDHLNDTANVWIAGGCTGVIAKVNSYMLSYLDPQFYPPGKSFLTKSEYEDYLNLVDGTSKQ